MPSYPKKPSAKAGPSKGAAKPKEVIAIDLEYDHDDHDDASSEDQLEELLGAEDMALPEGLPAEMWRRSPSPIESWDDAEGACEDGSWPVRIIGEEVDASGKIRYEIEWETWRRNDGTNTTWNIEDIHPEEKRRMILRDWNRKQARKRKELAADSLNIELTPTIDIHNNRTRLRAQAYDEKHAAPPTSDHDVITRYLEEKAKESWYLRENRDEEWESEGEKRRSKRQRSAKTVTVSTTSGSRAPSSVTLKSVSASQQQSRASSSTSFPRPLATPTISSGGGKSVSSSRAPSSSTWPSTASAAHSHARSASSTASAARPTPTPSVSSTLTSHSGRSTPSNSRFLTPAASSVTLFSESPSLPPGRPFTSIPAGPPMSEKARGKQPARYEPFSPPPPPVPARPAGLSRREALAREWSSHGARIHICNDVDDEAIPPLPRGFRYLEKGYQFDTGLEYLKGDPGFLMGCAGHDSCSIKSMMHCDCQDESNLKGQHGGKICAYDSKGLFRFNVPRGVEVLECTPNCECLVNCCPNRVLQRDRDVPLEVFKTRLRGWGVRAMAKVQRGKVLGMYTGLLIRRQDAKDKMDYCFDLDGQEDLSNDTDRSQDGSYSVDSERVGNWTRFINHSCDPNLTVYEVVYDQPPGQGIPYLAYAVLRDIKPGEELTFNYNPTIDEEADENLKKGKGVKYVKTSSGKRIPKGRQECHCGAANCRGYF